MKAFAIGLSAALISTAAFAQTSMSPSPDSSSGGPNIELRQRSGGQSQSETTGATEIRRSGTRSGEESVRTRTESGARIGVETRERTGVSVRSRTTVEDEPIEVRRRRSVMTIEDDEPETRTVIKRKAPSKRVVVKKRKPASRFAVRSRSRQIVEEPSVEVRRRTVRRTEFDEPDVSVSRRTTLRRSQEVGVGTGVSVEQRRSSVRQQSSSQTNDMGVSATTRRRSTSPETTGSVSGRGSTDSGMSPSGGTSPGRSGTRRLPPMQEGGSGEEAMPRQ
jgi:hypothetical protein